MTEDQIKEVKMAWARGETVQYLYGHSGSQEWLDWKIKNGINFEHSHGWRVKPKTITINGIEVPEPLREILDGKEYYLVDLQNGHLKAFYANGCMLTKERISRGICHATKEAADLHTKALLSLTDGTK